MTGALLVHKLRNHPGFKPIRRSYRASNHEHAGPARLSRGHSEPRRRGLRTRRAALRCLPSDAFAVALLRLARASTGAEGAKSHLEPVLQHAFASGRRKVLIAGSCDTGVLALTARAGAVHDLAITV